MSWLLIALLAPVLFSVTNHIDKYLIGKYFRGHGGAGALIIFSSLVGVIVAPFILIIEQGVLNISFLQVLLLFVVAALTMLAILLYFYALQRDETSVVVPLFQLIPVFAFVLAYFVLGEILTFSQLGGASLVILGSVVISLTMEERKLRLKRAVLLLMTTASLLLAIGGVIFKVVALETGFWVATFWSFTGDVLFAIFVLLFIRSYRQQFIDIIRANKIPVIGINVLNELIGVGASLAITFAFLLAPVALVQTVNGFQPFFVLVYGVILTLLFPYLGTESLVRRHLIQKGLAIFVMFIGVYVMSN